MQKEYEYKGITYIADSSGKIIRPERIDKRGKVLPAYELTQRLNPDGYWFVTIGGKGKRTSMPVHRIIARCFIPKPESNEKLEIDHIDNNRLNNDYTNLQWITHIENVKKIPKERKVGKAKGEKNPRAKLTEKDIPVIKQLYKEGITIAAIARRFGIGWTTVSHVLKRES